MFGFEYLEPRLLLSADLVGTSFQATPETITDGAVHVSFTIANQGDADAGAFEVQIIHSDDNIFGNGDDEVVGTVPIAGLAAGASGDFEADVQLSLATLFANLINDDPAGQGIGHNSSSVDYIGMKIDATDQVVEDNESNNLGSALFEDFDDVSYFPWDVNGDGGVSPEDTIFLANRVGSAPAPLNVQQLNGVQFNAQSDSNSTPGDFNGDGKVTTNEAAQSSGRVGIKENNQAKLPRPTALTGPVSPVLLLQLGGKGDAIKGDSQIFGFEGWIVVDSYSWGLTTPFQSPAQFEAFEFHVDQSLATPRIFDALTNGRIFHDADLRLVDQVSGNTLAEWEFSDVSVVSYRTDMGQESSADIFSIDYATIDVSMNVFNLAGVRVDIVSAGWDVTKNAPTQMQSFAASVGTLDAALKTMGLTDLVDPAQHALNASESADGDIYLLNLGGIGGSQEAFSDPVNEAFKGWIPLDSFSFGVSVNAFAGIGERGEPQFDLFSLNAPAGPHSPDLLKSLATFKHFDSAEIAVIHTAGNNSFDYLYWQMQNVVVTSLVSSFESEEDLISESFELSPAIAGVQFTDAVFSNPTLGLQRGETVTAGWDLITNQKVKVKTSKDIDKSRAGQDVPAEDAFLLIGDDNKKFEEVVAYSVSASNNFAFDPLNPSEGFGLFGDRVDSNVAFQLATGSAGLLDRYLKTAQGNNVNLTLATGVRSVTRPPTTMIWTLNPARLTGWQIKQTSGDEKAVESVQASFLSIGVTTIPIVGNEVVSANKQAKFGFDLQMRQPIDPGVLSSNFILLPSQLPAAPATSGAGQLYLKLSSIPGSVLSGPYQDFIEIDSYTLNVFQTPLDPGIPVFQEQPLPRAIVSALQVNFDSGALFSPEYFAAAIDGGQLLDVTLSLDARGKEVVQGELVEVSRGETLRWFFPDAGAQGGQAPFVTGYTVDQTGKESLSIEFDVAQLNQRVLNEIGQLQSTQVFAWNQRNNMAPPAAFFALNGPANPIAPVSPRLFTDDGATLMLGIPGLPGGSTTQGFANQIPLSTFRFSVANNYSPLFFSPLEVFFTPFSFETETNVALPGLLDRIGSGEALPEVVLSVLRSSGGPLQRAVQWRLEDARVTDLAIGLGGKDFPSDPAQVLFSLDFDRLATRTYKDDEVVNTVGHNRLTGEAFDTDEFAVVVAAPPAGNPDGHSIVPGNTPSGLYLMSNEFDGGELIEVSSFGVAIQRQRFTESPGPAFFADVFVDLPDVPINSGYPVDLFFATAANEILGPMTLVQVINEDMTTITPLYFELADVSGATFVTSFHSSGSAPFSDLPKAAIFVDYDTFRLTVDTPGDGRAPISKGWDVKNDHVLGDVMSLSQVVDGGAALPLFVQEVRDDNGGALQMMAENPVADLSFVLIDGNGTPGIQVGEQFQVEVHFTDIDAMRAFFDDGSNQVDHPFVYSAFADILFDPAVLQAVGLTHAPNYGNGATGFLDNGSGIVDEAGSSMQTDVFTSLLDAGIADIDPGTLLFTIDFEAVAPGFTFIDSEPADNTIPPGPLSSSTTLFGLDGDQRANVNYPFLDIDVLGTDLRVQAPGPSGAQGPGDTFIYDVIVDNIGTVDAEGVVVTVVLDPNLTFNAAQSSPAWMEDSGTLTFDVGTLGLQQIGAHFVGQVSVTVNDTLPVDFTEFVSTFSAMDDGAFGEDPTLGDNSVATTTDVALANLGITLSDSGVTAAPGDMIAYEIVLTNKGNTEEDYTVTFTIAPGASFDDAGSDDFGWTDNGDGTFSNATPFTLFIDDQITFHFNVVVDNPLDAGITEFMQNVTVTTTRNDIDLSDNSASVTTPITNQVTGPDLGIVITGTPDSVEPGSPILYLLQVTNEAGAAEATNVVVTLTVPEGLNVPQATLDGGWTDLGNRMFSFSVGTVPPNTSFFPDGSDFFVFVANPVPDNTMQLTVDAVITDDGANGEDPNLANNTSSDTTTIIQPTSVDLTFAAVLGPASVDPGEAFSYTIDTPANNGTVEATNVVITATLPAGLTLDSSSPNNPGWVDQGGGVLTLSIGSLPATPPPAVPPASLVLLPVKADDNLAVSTLSTTFTIADDGASGADTNPGDNTMTVMSSVNQPAVGPNITINDVSMNEGDAGNTAFVFTVTLDAAPIDDAVISFIAANGTATLADSDFDSSNGQLTFTPGSGLSQTITVNVNGDTTVEDDETFVVGLTLTSGTAQLTDDQGVGTIVNDDEAPPERTLLQRVGAGAGTGSFKFSQTDPFNNLFDFAYKGSGFVTLFAEPDGRVTIVLENPDPKASLTVKSSGAGDDMLGSLESPNGFGKFSGKGVGFAGDIVVAGRVDSFTAADVADQHIVSFGGAPTDKPAKLTFEQFVDVNFTSTGPVQLTLTDWLDTDPDVNRDSFTVPWAKSITVKGNKKDPNQPGLWSADIVMSGASAPKGLALGSLKANGLGDGITMEVFGDIKTIDVKDSIDDLEIVAATVGSFKFFGGHDIVLDVEEVGSVKSTGSWIGGFVQASSIKSLDIKADKKGVGDLIPGDATGFSVRMFADVANPKSKAAIGKISIDGHATNVNITDEATLPAQAGVGSITIKGTSDALNIVARATLKSLKLADVQDGALTAGSVGAIQATRWLDGAVNLVDVKSIKTTGDKKANLAGDYMPATTINNGGNSQAKAVLGSASIAGVLGGGLWNVTGPVGAITAGSVDAWDTKIVGDLKSLASKASFTNSFLAAFNIDKFDVKLQVDNSNIIAGGPNGTTGPHAVGSFKVGSAFTNSTLKVGVDPVNGVFNDGDDLFLAGDDNAITSLTIAGPATGDGVFVAGFVKSPVKVDGVFVDPSFDDRFVIN